jgi:hypothetical protein
MLWALAGRCRLGPISMIGPPSSPRRFVTIDLFCYGNEWNIYSAVYRKYLVFLLVYCVVVRKVYD